MNGPTLRRLCTFASAAAWCLVAGLAAQEDRLVVLMVSSTFAAALLGLSLLRERSRPWLALVASSSVAYATILFVGGAVPDATLGTAATVIAGLASAAVVLMNPKAPIPQP